MLHASPTRAAHRAAPASMSQIEPQRILSGLGALILLGICGLGGFFIVADKRRAISPEPTGAPSASTPWAITSRAVDPKPLRLSEIFPSGTIKLEAGAEPYRLSMTHIDSDCDIATTGVLGDLLGEQDCSQVVRAGMTAPYGGYQVTAGVFNLADEAGTAHIAGRLRALIDDDRGAFATMGAGAAPGVEPQAAPLSQVGWQERGHYLLYCVITRPDGSPVQPADPYARRITTDLLGTYLSEEKIGARTLDL